MHRGWISITILGILVACSSSKPENKSIPTSAPTAIAETLRPTAFPTKPILQRTIKPTPTEIRVFISETTSPDGKYIAEFIRYGPYKIEDVAFEDVSLKITHVDGGKEIKLVEETREFRWLGAIYPSIFYWPVNGDYVYYMTRRGGDGCFPIYGNALTIVDLENGSQKEILPMALREWIVSMDKELFVYVDYKETRVNLLNLESDELKTFEINTDLDSIWPLVWSPDGSQIAMTAINEICVGNQPTEIILLDMLTGSQTTIEPPAPHSFIIENWPEPDQIILRANDIHQWTLNPLTGIFTAIEP